MGFFDQTVESLPTPAARVIANPLVTGHHGSHDLHLRTLQAKGVTLTGHFLGTEHGSARFAPDLQESVAWGDRRFNELMGLIERFAAGHTKPTRGSRRYTGRFGELFYDPIRCAACTRAQVERTRVV